MDQITVEKLRQKGIEQRVQEFIGASKADMPPYDGYIEMAEEYRDLVDDIINVLDMGNATDYVDAVLHPAFMLLAMKLTEN